MTGTAGHGHDLFAAPRSPKPLREHQLRAIGMVRQSLRAGNKRVVVQMPTGAGKTRTAAEIIAGALGKGNRVAFTVPSLSLIDQTVAAFEEEGIDAIGVMQAYHHRTDSRQPVQIVSVQTLQRRQRPDVDMVIVDECHQRFAAVSRWIKDEPDKVFIGLSATPWARGMAEEWQDLLIPVRMQELIDRGFLSPFRAFAPNHPDLSGVKVVAGEYHEGQLADAMSVLTADVVDTWLQRGRGLPTLVFAVNRAHAAKLVEQFAAKGVAMGYCDAYVDLIERRILFDRMASGKIAGIVNVGTLTTGVDADVRCVVLARPTRSEMLYCLDSETEILTRSGWRGMGEVHPDDMVASCADGDPRKGRWSKVLSVVERDMEPSERWVEYDAPRANFRVTDRHRLLAARDSQSPYAYTEAGAVAAWNGSVFMPTAVHMEQPGVPLTDDELYLIGIMMTDGTWTHVAGSISQSERHPEIIQRIEGALQRSGISYRKSPVKAPREGAGIPQRHRRWRYNLSAGSPKPKEGTGRFAPTKGSVKFEGRRGFRHLLPYLDKGLAPALMALSSRQFEVLLDGIWDGDGWKRKGVDYTPQSRTICTARLDAAERLQVLGSINGYTVHLRTEHKNRTNPIHVLTFTPKDWRSCGGYAATGKGQRPQIEVKPATKERVWCVETEHGAIVTRRRGKVTVMGNCQMVGRGLRTAPGKNLAVILDHADNHARMGFVTDIHHPALLAGGDKAKPVAKDRGEPMPKECGGCGGLKPPKVHACPHCGFEPKRQPGVEVEDGELVEIRPGMVKAKTTKANKSATATKEEKQRFFSELVAIAAMRGRSSGWVANSYRERFDVWPRGMLEEKVDPSEETLSWVKAKDIRWAKRRAR